MLRTVSRLRPSIQPLLSTCCCSSRGVSQKLADEILRKEWNISLSKTDDDKNFTVKLNNISLKTPMKNLFQIPNETLALAIANEWKCVADKRKLDLKTMHLTTMAYTAIDNPFKESKIDIIASLIEYLKFDTVRFRDAQIEDLLKRQSRHWDPLIGWFEHKYGCHLPIDYGQIASTDTIPARTLETMTRHLDSHKDWPLVGIKFMTQNLRSLILATCLMERFLKVEDAVDLARLETKYQTDKWSKVEWEHDIDEQCTRARVAAGALFYHLAL